MIEPKWLLTEVILNVHSEQISEFGGRPGIRDFDLLESALYAPKNLYHYNYPKPSLEKLSAKYAYGITRNHPFVDGNKRMSLISCELFLENNGRTLETSDDEKYEIIIRLAEKSISFEELYLWIEQHSLLLK